MTALEELEEYQSIQIKVPEEKMMISGEVEVSRQMTDTAPGGKETLEVAEEDLKHLSIPPDRKQMTLEVADNYHPTPFTTPEEEKDIVKAAAVHQKKWTTAP